MGHSGPSRRLPCYEHCRTDRPAFLSPSQHAAPIFICHHNLLQPQPSHSQQSHSALQPLHCLHFYISHLSQPIITNSTSRWPLTTPKPRAGTVLRGKLHFLRPSSLSRTCLLASTKSRRIRSSRCCRIMALPPRGMAFGKISPLFTRCPVALPRCPVALPRTLPYLLYLVLFPTCFQA